VGPYGEAKIAAQVAQELKVRLIHAPARTTIDPATYELYLQGRGLLARHTPGDMPEAIRLFERVTAKDPDFAPGHVGLALAIGSMPHQDSLAALDQILGACPQAPCWPQLPALGFQENMMVQFSEGIPCIRVDWEKNKLYFARPEDCPEELAQAIQAGMKG